MENTNTRNRALDQLRAALIAERERMALSNPNTLQVLAVSENLATDDQSALLHEQFVALSRNSNKRYTLGQIQAALDRFDHGDYGRCEDCDQEISSKRLRAIPWALRCVRCQEEFEARPTEDLAMAE